MTLKGNTLLKVIVPIVAVLVMLIVIKGCSSGGDNSKNSSQTSDASRQLTQQEKQDLGISDTPQDTVATLVGKINHMQQENTERQQREDDLVKQNTALAQRNSNINAQINDAISNERSQQQTHDQNLMSHIQSQLDRLRGNHSGNANNNGGSGNSQYPLGLGLENGGGPTNTYGNSNGDLTWVNPMDAHVAPKGSGQGEGKTTYPSAFGTSFGQAVDDYKGNATGTVNRDNHLGKVDNGNKKSDEKPVYTVPENSTLMGSLAMTALVGRVPVNGTVNDPYPFKAIIGRDNLIANGIEIPEVQAAVVSGTAQGDWTLSCVRGNITSMTFVFNDGTIRTLPMPDRGSDSDDLGSGGNNNQNQSISANNNGPIGGTNSIGWISDQYGIPCVGGMRRSNAKQYLGTEGLLTAAGAGVAAFIGNSDDSSSFTSMGTDGQITEGETGNQAVSQIMAGGVKDMTDWVNKLYGQAFAAVYVPPGAHIAIHITKELPIDYETKGRKVRYASAANVSSELP